MSSGKEINRLLSGSDNMVVKSLYEQYANKLLVYSVRHYTIDEDDAWTVVYKTIYKMADTLGGYQFENEQKRAAFIFRTHINFLKNYFRDQKSFEKHHLEVELQDHLHDKEPEPEPEHKPNENLRLLQQELDKLEDWQRILLLMRGQDMPYSKIAEFVNKPESQLKVYYARLKKQLTDKLNAELEKQEMKQHVSQ